MSIILSKGCEYALQAVIFLATQSSNTPITQREISEALNIPRHFLGKILQLLARHQIVISYKGKTGGFVLGRPAKDIFPFHVIKAIDGANFLDQCVLGFPRCDDDCPCPVHDEWKRAKEIINQMLRNKNIEQLSKKIDIKLKFIHDTGR